MRNNILSFLCAAAVLVTIFSLFHYFIEQSGNHQAMAAPSLGGEVGHGELVARRAHRDMNKALLKTISTNPQKLLTLTGRDVLRVLKAPGLVRQDFPTVVWQYRDEACVLDLYFKSQSADVSAAPVAHYEIRARDGGEEGAFNHCVQGISRAQNIPRMVEMKKIYKAL